MDMNLHSDAVEIIFTKCEIDEKELLSSDFGSVQTQIRSSLSERYFDYIFSGSGDLILYALGKISQWYQENATQLMKEKTVNCKSPTLKIAEIILKHHQIEYLDSTLKVILLAFSLTLMRKEYFTPVETVLFARVVALIWVQNPMSAPLKQSTDNYDKCVSNDNKNLFFDELKKLDKRVIAT
jgi:hypothetical protein